LLAFEIWVFAWTYAYRDESFVGVFVAHLVMGETGFSIYF
jgi:hypothetical protein